MAAELLADRLSTAEAALTTLNQLLLRGDAPAFEAGAVAFQRSLATLMQAASTAAEPLPPDLAQRMVQLSRALARQRDQLARRAVLVERGLATVLPQAQPTYAAPGRRAAFGGPAPRLYSSPAR